MDSMTERLEHARRHRNEEQVVAAILHMSSPWGLFAILSSGVIWAASRTRSRFLLIHALQAFLFQTFAFLVFGATFLLFMAGFYYAMFSGLIERTGYTEPELTSRLILAAGVGFAALLLFRFVLPLWGVWAGIQVLRGRSFRYPLLGALVIRWTSRQPFVAVPEPHVRAASGTEGSAVIAGLGHLAMFAQFSLFLAPVLWLMNRPRSRFLTQHLFQAGLFQIGMTLVLVVLYFLIWGSGVLMGLLQMSGLLSPETLDRLSTFARLTYFPASGLIVLALLLIAGGVCVLAAAVQAFRGKEFHYPLVGRWLARYLGSQPAPHPMR